MPAEPRVHFRGVPRYTTPERWEALAVESETGLASLVGLAEAQQSEELARRAAQGVDALIATWEEDGPAFGELVGLLGQIRASPWFLEHGGRRSCRVLLDGLLDRLDLARAHDWHKLVTLPDLAPAWTETDERRLDEGLKHYCETGVFNEWVQCPSLTEKRALRKTLDELARFYAIDLAYAIECLDKDIARLRQARHGA